MGKLEEIKNALGAESPKHLPPEDVSPSELWMALTSAPRPSKVVPFPGLPQHKIRVQVLRLDEHEACRLQALHRLKEKKFNPGEVPDEVYSDSVAVEVLARALVNVDPVERPDNTVIYWPLAPSADALRRAFTADQLVSLFNLYLAVQHEFGPTERSVATKEELDAWIKRLSEAEDIVPLGSCTWPQLAELSFLLARRASQLSELLESRSTTSPRTSESDPASSDSGTS